MELYTVVSISSGDLVHKNYKPHFKMLRQYSCLHKRLEKVLLKVMICGHRSKTVKSFELGNRVKTAGGQE